MSFALPSVDLTGQAVGGSGYILLQNMGISAGGVSAHPSARDNTATIYFFNDSGCGLLLEFQTGGQSINIPAGAWVPIAVSPGEARIKWTVLYVLPNPPVSTLLLTWYAPGEIVPPTSTLGNSPVGIGGSVQTSSVQTLSQEGQAKTLLTIDIGDSVLAQLIKINNDGTATWNVDVAGVAHTIFAIAAATNYLKIGQSGDTSEVLGTLAVDGSVKTNTLRDNTTGADLIDLAATLVTANQLLLGILGLTVPNTVYYQARDTGAINRGVLGLDASNILHLRAALTGTAKEISFRDVNDTEIGWFDNNGAGVSTGRLTVSGTNGGINFIVGGLSRVAVSGPFTLATTGHVCAHGLGAIPDFVIAVNDAGNSAGAIANAINFGGMDATNVTVYSASGTPSVRLLAIKL